MGKWLLGAGCLLALCVAWAAGAAPEACLWALALPMAQVPLRRVKLYTSGAGYFEHQGTVKDHAGLTLVFGAEQMNSLLKSFVARDFDGGSIDDISYPAPTRLDEVLGAFSIDVTGLSSRYALLERLRGERVRFFPADGGAEFAATVLGVEKLASKAHLPVESVNLLRDNGEIVGVSLSSIRHFTPENPALVKELGQALAALAAARNDTRRPFSLAFNGSGERRVAFGYVLDMPQWKPTYRLTINEDGKGAFLQGWALVENRTDNDWEGLQLSLVAGSPNNLKTLLYDYRNKPTGDDAEDEDVDDMCVEEDAPMYARAAGAMCGAAAAPAPARFNSASSRRPATGRAMGEMFAYDVAAPVTLARRQATMLEIVAGDIGAEKVLYYDADEEAPCPDNALFLKNDTGKVMLAGPVAVFDEGYGGDATLEHLPQGGETVVRYGRALDIKAETHDFDESTYVAVKFHRGTLEVTRRVTENAIFQFHNPGNKAHTLLLAVTQRRGWTLADGLKPWKNADHRDTFRVAIPAGQDTKFAYGRFRIEEETFILTDAKQWSRAVSICSHGILTDAQKKAWKKAGELHAQVKEAEKRLADDEQALKELSENQERTRQNLDALADEQSDFHRQLVARLAEEIKQTDARQQAIKQRRAELRAAEQALVDYLQGLEL